MVKSAGIDLRCNNRGGGGGNSIRDDDKHSGLSLTFGVGGHRDTVNNPTT